MAERRMSQETSVLAAARAAMDPDRAAWQNDILISAIVEVLARKGPISKRELKDELQATWIGQRTSPSLLTEALDRAWEQDLLIKSLGRKGKETWSLPAGVKAEADHDREWARLLLSETQDEIKGRLRERFPDHPEHLDKARVLTKHLVTAMITASRDVFQAVQNSASPKDLREVRLNLRAGIPQLRATVDPAELADFVAELVLDAASPDVRFADSLLSTIVAGQVLHGMVCRQDLTVSMPPTTLVLDTSELLALASHDLKVQELMESFFETARGAGCRILLTDRVEAEWQNHWSHADELVETASRRWGEHNVDALQLYQVRVLSEYSLSVQAAGRFTSFVDWSRERRRLGPLVAKYGIERVTTADLVVDRAFVDAFQEEIRAIQTEDGRPKTRGVERCITDAISADLIRRHRLAAADSLVPTAWFVASDRTSERAYERLREADPFPLALSAKTWLLHYAAFDQKGATADRATLADRVTEDLILEAFISVSTSYTDDEMLEMGDLLSADDVLDRDDVRAVLVDGFLHPEQASAQRIRDVARARNVRRSGRVIRSQRVAAEKHREIEERAKKAEARAASLQDQLAAKTDSGSATEERLRRTIQVVLVMGALLVVLLFAVREDWLGTAADVIAGVAWLGVSFEGYRYVRETATPRGVALSGVASVLLLIVVQVLLGWSESPLK